MALGMLGWLPMMSYVEQRKLSFLQSLCTMPPNLLQRKVFDLRLNLFVLIENKNQSGFIPDIWKALQKYCLEEYLLRYLATSLFPTNCTWKTIVTHKIRIYYKPAWTERVDNMDNKPPQVIFPFSSHCSKTMHFGATAERSHPMSLLLHRNI